MSRLVLLVALVALAAAPLRVSASTQLDVRVEGELPVRCQLLISDGFSLFEVSGTVTARTDEQSGRGRARRRLQVLSGDYSDGRFSEPLTRVRSSLSRSGEFRFSARARFNEYVESCEGGGGRRTTNNEPARYLLRAPGCDDFMLEVSAKSPPPAVMLSCGQSR